MLVLNKKQIDSFSEELYARFVAHCVNKFSIIFTERNSNLGEDALRELVVQLINWARSHGVHKDSNIEKLVQYHVSGKIDIFKNENISLLTRINRNSEDIRIEEYLLSNMINDSHLNKITLSGWKSNKN